MFGRLFGLVFSSVLISHILFAALIAFDLPKPTDFPLPPPPNAMRSLDPNAIGAPPIYAPKNASPSNAIWLALLCQFILIVIISRIGSRMMVKPIEDLVKAATKLGENIKSPPIVESGPMEARLATQVFNRMQEQLVEQIDDRARFLAAVSHDLRTPLTRMKLRMESVGESEMAKKFKNDICEMSAMVDSTLTYLRSDGAALDLQLIDIESLVQALVDDEREVNSSITLKGHAKPIIGDAQLLRRALQNIIENAIRYGGSAEIFLHDESKKLLITIRDFGEGIPEDKLQAVLKPFVRIEGSRNKCSGGTGLGLTIAYDAIKRHGGTFNLANHPAKGLVVTIIIFR